MNNEDHLSQMDMEWLESDFRNEQINTMCNQWINSLESRVFSHDSIENQSASQVFAPSFNSSNELRSVVATQNNTNVSFMIDYFENKIVSENGQTLNEFNDVDFRLQRKNSVIVYPGEQNKSKIQENSCYDVLDQDSFSTSENILPDLGSMNLQDEIWFSDDVIERLNYNEDAANMARYQQKLEVTKEVKIKMSSDYSTISSSENSVKRIIILDDVMICDKSQEINNMFKPIDNDSMRMMRDNFDPRFAMPSTSKRVAETSVMSLIKRPNLSGEITWQRRPDVPQLNDAREMAVEPKTLFYKLFSPIQGGVNEFVNDTGIQNICWENLTREHLIKMSNKIPTVTTSVSLKTSVVSTDAFVNLIQEFQNLEMLNLKNCNIGSNPLSERSCNFNALETVNISNSICSLNMLNTTSIKKFRFTDLQFPIPKIALALMAWKLVEQKNLQQMTLGITEHTNILILLNELEKQIPSLSVLRLEYDGGWYMNAFLTFIKHNENTLTEFSIRLFDCMFVKPSLINEICDIVVALPHIKEINFWARTSGRLAKTPKHGFCYINKLKIKSDDENILKILLSYNFINALSLFIYLKSYRRSCVDNQIMEIKNLVHLCLTVVEDAELNPALFCGRNWKRLESIKFSAASVYNFPFCSNILKSLSVSCKKLHTFWLTLEDKNINMSWLKELLKIKTLRNVNINSSRMDSRLIKSLNLRSNVQLTINNVVFNYAE